MAVDGAGWSGERAISAAKVEQRVTLFTPRNIADYAVRFLGLLLLAWCGSRCVKLLYRLAGVAEEIPSKWPLSLVETRLARKLPDVHAWPVDLLISACILMLFWVFVRFGARRVVRSRVMVLAAGLALLLLTNVIHGPWYGLVYPHQGAPKPNRGALQYYHDAIEITSVGQFLGQFEARQEELGCHSRTHPPGAVLFFYAVVRALGHGAAVSVAIAVVSVALSGTFLYWILRREFDHQLCGYVTLLFLLIPSVQVYYCASLDAVIASLLLGVVAFLRCRNSVLSIAGAAVCLFCASFLTFAASFVVPVMVGYELITTRTVRRSAAILLVTAVTYLGLHGLWGFNYWIALKTASALENPGGFLLFAAPGSYLMTRLENAGDILVFFGPFLLVLFGRGVRLMRGGVCRELSLLTALGIVTLLAMFLTGAFRTGETARACLFIYPYLIFPVAVYLQHHGCRDGDKQVLLWLVFGQTLAMQTLAGYYW